MESPTLKIKDFHQGESYANYMKMIGWEVVEIKGIKVFIKSLGIFAMAKLQRFDLNMLDEEVFKIFAKKRVIYAKFEPLNTDSVIGKRFRLKKDHNPLLATKTLVVTLDKSEKDIMAGLKKDARYTLRKLETKRLEISIGKFGEFYKIWQMSAKRKNIWIPSNRDYEALIKVFGKDCFVITVGEMAGALILMNQESAHYYYAGATAEGTKQDLPYLVVWEAMKEAKRRKAKRFDFEGIFDQRFPNNRWRGFSHFKKSFGGEEIEYPGSYTYIDLLNLFR